MKSIANILTLIGLVIIFSSCSDDDDNSSTAPPTGGGQGGSGSFQVSGAVESEHSGMADFRARETIGGHTWGIFIFDHGPQTFNLDFQLYHANEAIEQPGPGTYTVGLGFSDEIFMGSYDFFEEGSFAPVGSYNSGLGGGLGELVITTSTDELVEGTFSFSAAAIDDQGNVTDSVSVTNGTFSAVPE